MTDTVPYYEDFTEIKKKIWSMLVNAVKDRGSPFRIPVFICGDQSDFDGRIVVLRKADETNNLIQYHSLKGKNEKQIATALKVHPYFLKQFSSAARHYSSAHAHNMLEELLEFDRKCKGVIRSSSGEYEHLREWLIRCVL